MTDIISLDKIFDSIKQIEDLHELDLLRDAINERYSEIRTEHFAVMGERPIEDAMIGDTIEFIKGISPKYLIGQTALITRVNPKSVTVDIPDEPSYRRFRGGRDIRCPKTIVKLI